MKIIEEMISVMQAYKEGKQIEVRCKTLNDWKIDPKPSWNWHNNDYRVKEEPKCRPYESSDEMIEDFCKRAGLEPTSMLMPVIWLKEKNSTTKRMIMSFVGDYVYTPFGNDFDNWSFNELFNKFTYLDGSPVGKIKE